MNENVYTANNFNFIIFKFTIYINKNRLYTIHI